MSRRGRHGVSRQRKVISSFRVLVLTEDSGGAMRYLRARLSVAGKLTVSVRPGSAPDAKNLLREGRSVLRAGDEADFVVLVFDRDHRRAIFDQTIKSCADSNDLMAIASSPSIEYWFLLHFEDCAPAIESAVQMTNLLKRHGPFQHYEKGAFDVRLALSAGDETKAVARSARQRAEVARTGAIVPWTEIDLLLDQLASISRQSGGLAAKFLEKKRELGK